MSNPVDSSECVGIVSDIAGCSESPLTSASSAFYFDCLKCRTPLVTSISPTNGTSLDTITITGSGFSTTECQNEVKFHETKCVVSLSTDTSIECKLDGDNNSTKIATYLLLNLKVNNRGAALNTEPNALNRNFIVFPHISIITPSQGSEKGGTPVTIKGGGFYDDVKVTMNSECTVKNFSYNEITCETAQSMESISTVGVKVYAHGQWFDALCKTDPCTFSYTSSATPQVTSVSPPEVSMEYTELTINGSLFGTDEDGITADVGGTPCRVTTVEDTSIKCNLSSLTAGSHLVRVHVAVKGYAASSIRVEVPGVITSVSPSSGSVMGGTKVTITGFGFKPDDTRVTFGDKECLQPTATPFTIECTTPEGTSGNVTIQVTSNSITYTDQPIYAYDPDLTPNITSVTPSSGSSGQPVNISGTGFSNTASDISVHIGNAECLVRESTEIQVICNLGIHSAGEFLISLKHNIHGNAIGSVSFMYSLAINSFSPNAGKISKVSINHTYRSLTLLTVNLIIKALNNSNNNNNNFNTVNL